MFEVDFVLEVKNDRAFETRLLIRGFDEFEFEVAFVEALLFALPAKNVLLLSATDRDVF